MFGCPACLHIGTSVGAACESGFLDFQWHAPPPLPKSEGLVGVSVCVFVSVCICICICICACVCVCICVWPARLPVECDLTAKVTRTIPTPCPQCLGKLFLPNFYHYHDREGQRKKAPPARHCLGDFKTQYANLTSTPRYNSISALADCPAVSFRFVYLHNKQTHTATTGQ